MTNFVNLCFILILVLGLYNTKLQLKKNNSSNKKAIRSTCWTYATNNDPYLEGLLPNNIGFTNKQTGVRKNIIYSIHSETCRELCQRNRNGDGCYSTYSYDRDFGIPAKSFVCWFSLPCAIHFNKTEYNMIDTSIKHVSKLRCNHLCDAIYGQEGRCRKRLQTDEEMVKKQQDPNYFCFYRGQQYAFKVTEKHTTLKPTPSPTPSSAPTPSPTSNTKK